MKLCVIGLGYIGLPTAAIFASNKVKVVGVDKNEEIVETVNKGNIHIEEPGLGEIIKKVVKEGYLSCSTSPEEADAYIIAVPTPNKNDEFLSCDLSYVKAAVKSVLPVLKKENVVIIESTIAPRTLDDEIRPMIEQWGFEVGKDVFLAHCPERVLPGQILYEMVNNNRIIGGVTPKCTEHAAKIYSKIVKGELLKTEAKTAEMTKLVENTFRDINIAFANELSKICNHLDINVLDVISMANKHPRVNIHNPGPGVGGHCLAVDPYFIYAKDPHTAKLIKLSRDINCSMPDYVVECVDNLLKNDTSKKILVLGVTYKPDVDDMRESPALKIIDKLKKLNYCLSVYDPHVAKYTNVDIADLAKYDFILCLVGHSEFKKLDIPATVKIFDATGSLSYNHIINYGNFYNFKMENR